MAHFLKMRDILDHVNTGQGFSSHKVYKVMYTKV